MQHLLNPPPPTHTHAHIHTPTPTHSEDAEWGVSSRIPSQQASLRHHTRHHTLPSFRENSPSYALNLTLMVPVVLSYR